MSAVCGARCEHGGLCTLPKGHEGVHKALYRQAEPEGGFWCSWEQS